MDLPFVEIGHDQYFSGTIMLLVLNYVCQSVVRARNVWRSALDGVALVPKLQHILIVVK
jgi:hypothetical protein